MRSMKVLVRSFLTADNLGDGSNSSMYSFNKMRDFLQAQTSHANSPENISKYGHFGKRKIINAEFDY